MRKQIQRALTKSCATSGASARARARYPSTTSGASARGAQISAWAPTKGYVQTGARAPGTVNGHQVWTEPKSLSGRERECIKLK